MALTFLPRIPALHFVTSLMHRFVKWLLCIGVIALGIAQTPITFEYYLAIGTLCRDCVVQMSRDMTKPTKWHVRPAKSQISLGIRPVWSVFAVRIKKAWVFSYPFSAQRRLWSDWADAQDDLSLRWAHSHFVGFVMLRLILWMCDGCFVGDMDVLWMTWTVCGYMWSMCWGWCDVFCGCVVCFMEDMDVLWMYSVCFVDA